MSNFEEYFSGTSHFLFKSDVTDESSKRELVTYILNEFSVMQLDKQLGYNTIRVFSSTDEDSILEVDYLGFVEMMEHKLIDGHRVMIVTEWDGLGSVHWLRNFAVVNDIVQRIANTRLEWKDKIKLLTLIGVESGKFFNIDPCSL